MKLKKPIVLQPLKSPMKKTELKGRNSVKSIKRSGCFCGGRKLKKEK